MTRSSRLRPRVWIALIAALVLARHAGAVERLTPALRQLSGHAAAVTSLALLRDSVHAVTGSRDATVKLWDLRNARLERTLAGHKGGVLAVAVSPDGKRAASGGEDHVVRVWALATGELTAMLRGHTGDVVGVAFLPGGQLLSAGGDGLRRWDVDKEETVWRTPPDAGGAVELSVSADGRRAAYRNLNDFATDVWDLSAGKRLAKLGSPPNLRPGLFLSRDGREVLGCGGEDASRLTRWDVASGKTLPLPEWFAGDRFAASLDGSLIVSNNGANYGPVVWDARSWRKLGAFDGVRDFYERLLAMAFTPDGKYLVATTGYPTPGGVPHTAKKDFVFVYDLSDLGAAPQTGPRAGKLSWDERALRVKLASGQTVALAESPFRHSTLTPHALADGLDAFYNTIEDNTGAHLLLHRTAGLLEEVPLERDARLDDVVCDGTHIWAASRRYGILLFDRDGKPVDRISAAAGLLPALDALKLQVLGPGRILAAGVDGPRARPGSGWCAIVERPADGAPVKVNTFFRESQLPDAWTVDADKTVAAFRPAWISEPPPTTTDAAGKTLRGIWIGCEGVPASPTPILRVDPAAATFIPYNLQRPSQRPEVATALYDAAPYWVGPQDFMLRGGHDRHTAGETGILPNARKLVVETAWPNERNGANALLRIGDQTYLPGKRWHRIDPRSWEIEDIGPGLRIDGALAEEEAQYFLSGVVGPAAFVRGRGNLYTFSVDPARPLRTPATLDGPGPGKPVPSGGAVEFPRGQTVFYAGQGALRFQDGKLVAGGYAVDYPFQNPKAALDAEAARAAAIVKRAPRDRERVGLSFEQLRKLRTVAAGKGRPGPDAAKLEPLFAKWEAAAPGPAREEAARPLLDAARATGEWDAQGRRDLIDGVRDVFTPRQWKLLNYEIPTAADK